MNGLVLIDKPGGCTSHDVVNRWRKLASMKRVGHLGTLDPMATGLLALLTGSATRLAQFFAKDDKTYLAEITFGLVSDTYDGEGQITKTGVAAPSDLAVLDAALQSFRGVIMQTPPAVSAKKVGGVRAYRLARKRLPIELQPVKVEIKHLELLSATADKIEVLITCSSGTYVRAIAHDLGQYLGCGALLSSLRRTHSGDFTVEQASTFEQLAGLAATGRLAEAVIPLGRLLPHIPAEYFDSSIELQIRQGRDFHTSPFVVPPGTPLVRALSHSGDLIAIGELKIPNLYHPGTVL